MAPALIKKELPKCTSLPGNDKPWMRYGHCLEHHHRSPEAPPRSHGCRTSSGLEAGVWRRKDRGEKNRGGKIKVIPVVSRINCAALLPFVVRTSPHHKRFHVLRSLGEERSRGLTAQPVTDRNRQQPLGGDAMPAHLGDDPLGAVKL